MLQILHNIFLSIMDTLTSFFGYHIALRVKDIMDNLAWALVTLIFTLIAVSHAVLHIRRSPDVEEEVAIQKVEHYMQIKVNQKSAWEVVESLIGYEILRFSPNTSIRFSTVKAIRIILLTIMIVFIVIGLLLSMWDYFPSQLHVPPTLLR